EGDAIICETPSFIGSLNSFRSFNAKLIGVPVEEDGMNIQLLKNALENNKNVKMIYIISNFQNPSGITTSLEKRKEIYSLAKKHDVVVIEDNPYGDLSFTKKFIPAIKTFDDNGNVLYCGSFSKTIAPGLRVGFVCANKEIIAKMTVAKQGEDVHTNILAQMAVYNFMEKYDYKAHLEKLREIYKNKADLMLNGIKTHFPKEVKVTIPKGGLFIWCTLPENCDMLEFCSVAVKKGVAVVPGNAFMPNAEDKTTSFRMNFSTPTDQKIVKGIEILGEILKSFI
ncbi:MAG: PLP-dependent aminotransferase family protein, partial [Oscillospiraceae bacterium]